MEQKAYTAGRFSLELDDKKPVGFVEALDGGHFKSDALKSPLGGRPGQTGGDFLVMQYPGRPKYEQVTIGVGASMTKPFWNWVAATLDRKPERRTGALVMYDFNNKERQRRTFKEALISEVQFPALDANSKNPARMQIKIDPEILEYTDGDRSSLQYQHANEQWRKQKMWQSSNFAMRLERFGDAKLNLSKVDAFTVKQGVMTDAVGAERAVRKVPGKLELPNLTVTFSEADAKQWMDWYKKAVVDGDYEHTTGSLIYFATDNTTEIMRVEFEGLCILNLDIEKYEARKESISRVKAVMSMEGLTLKPGSGVA
jgi:hypothetical protein